MKKTSQISGQGYGDKHNWQRGSTAQVGATPWDKGTGYHCEDCGAGFNHAYDLIPDIFEAIKEAGVSEECEVKFEKPED